MPRAGDHLVAGADAEHLVRQRHGAARELRGQERAGIDVAVALDRARHQHARKRLGRRQLQVGIVLIVAQQDVVARRALLDDVVLERQRLDHRVGDDDFEARRLRPAARRGAGSSRRRRGTSASDRARTAPCRRRASRLSRCSRGRRPAAPAAGQSVPSDPEWHWISDCGSSGFQINCDRQSTIDPNPLDPIRIVVLPVQLQPQLDLAGRAGRDDLAEAIARRRCRRCSRRCRCCRGRSQPDRPATGAGRTR